MEGSTLIVEWSKNAKSGSTKTDKTLTIGLDSRKKLNPFELKKCKNVPASIIILVSRQDGGTGPKHLILQGMH